MPPFRDDPKYGPRRDKYGRTLHDERRCSRGWDHACEACRHRISKPFATDPTRLNAQDVLAALKNPDYADEIRAALVDLIMDDVAEIFTMLHERMRNTDDSRAKKTPRSKNRRQDDRGDAWEGERGDEKTDAG